MADFLPDDMTLTDFLNGNINNLSAWASDYVPPHDKVIKVPYTAVANNFNGYTTNTNITKENLTKVIYWIIQNNNFVETCPIEELKSLTYAIITLVTYSGALHQTDQIEREWVVLGNINITALTNDNKNLIKSIVKCFPTALNLISLSVINFVRFNHHFPHEKRNWIKKSLIGMSDTTINAVIPNNGKVNNAYYDYIVNASKGVDDYLYYYFYIKIGNHDKIAIANATHKRFYSSVNVKKLTALDPYVEMRKSPTTNGFWVWDLLHYIFNDMKKYNILFMLPNSTTVIELLNLRKYLINAPFNNHPSRAFHSCTDPHYNNRREYFETRMTRIGGFLYEYCIKCDSNIAGALSKNKYKELSNAADKSIVNMIFEWYDTSIGTLSNEIKLKIRGIMDIKVVNWDDDADDWKQKNTDIITACDATTGVMP